MIAARTITRGKRSEIASTIGGDRCKRAGLFVLPSFALTCTALARVAWGEGRTFIESVARRLCKGSRMSHGCVGGLVCSVPSRCWTFILDREAFDGFGKCDEPLVFLPMTLCRRRWGGGRVCESLSNRYALASLGKKGTVFSSRAINRSVPSSRGNGGVECPSMVSPTVGTAFVDFGDVAVGGALMFFC